MAQPEKFMAAGIGQGPEAAGSAIPQTSTNPIEGQHLPRKFSREQVLANAQLSESERIKAAGKLLGSQLTEEQQTELLWLHKVGENRPEAGVYNYTKEELEEKVRRGREAVRKGVFTPEQYQVLIRGGLAGKLIQAEFAAVNPGFDPNSYTDPKVKEYAEKLQTWGNAGKVDEVVTARFRAQIKKLTDNLELDPDEASDLNQKVEAWEKAAVDPSLPQAQRALSLAERAYLKEMVDREGGSIFSMAKHVYEYYMSLSHQDDPVKQQELTDKRNEARNELVILLEAADQAGVLTDAREKALKFYQDYRAAKRRDKWGYDKEKTINYARMQSYNEVWGDDPNLKQLETTFKGVGKYLFDGIVAEAYKELNKNESAPSLNVIAKEEFRNVKEQRRIARLREKKYDVYEYYGRRSYALTAENAAELPGAVLDWVRDQLAEVPDSDMQTVDTKLKEIRAEAEQLLGTNRTHLENDEGQDVTEDHPDFKRAKAASEAVTDSIGYEKIISWDEKIVYEGGGEVAASYAERFASGYLGHHDAIYLMRRLARILLKLRTHRGGTYWTGHPFSEEKVDLGYMREYRQKLQEEIIADATSHDIFTETIFAKYPDLFPELIKTQEDVEAVQLGYSSFFNLREKYHLKYSADDPLERMLLDPGDQIRQRIAATGDAEALRNHDIRIKILRDTKVRRDAEDGLAGMTPTQRKNAVRQKILQKMQEKINDNVLAGTTREAMDKLRIAFSHGGANAYDEALWKWVESYDSYRIKAGLHIEGDADWYPTGWDMVRMKIDIPEKVLNRKLTDEQIDAMYEKVQYGPDVKLDDYRITHALDEARFAFQVGRGYSMLEMEDALYGGIRTRIRDENGKVIDPSHMTRRIFDIVQERLEKAITEEEVELNRFRATKEAEIIQAKQARNFQKAKELQIELDKKILSAQFLATHALKAAGFVDGKLPVYDGQLKGDTTINFFGNVLAAYGVNVAFGEKISHNAKDWLYEILERGRRAWQSEWNIAAQKEMVGTYPVPELDYDTDPNSPTYGQLVPQYDAQGNVIKAEAYRSNVYGEKVPISERRRIVSPGAPNEHQGITDNRFNQSTSGGIAVPEFTDELADLLFAVSMTKLGVSSIAGLHGVIHGLDEVQAIRIQKIFTSMDAVYSAKERTAAYNARRAFMGGKDAEGKSRPGFANEPFEGGYKSADWLLSQIKLIKSYGLDNTSDYVVLMQQYRESGLSYSEFQDKWTSDKWKHDKPVSAMGQKLPSGNELEKLRQLSYLDLDHLNKAQVDEIYSTMGGVYHNFTDYLSARKGCIQSRGGRTLRSWEEENHKSFYVFRRKIREAMMGKKDANGKWTKKPEYGFVMRLGYSSEVGSEVIMRLLITVLMDGGYHVLRDFEVDQRVRDGTEILSSVLTDQETQEGFQLKDANGNITKTFVIPDEKKWGEIVEPRVRKALENVRRRGLLEFMREEGYTIYEREAGKVKVNQKGEKTFYKEVLGQGLPSLVQDIKIKEDSRRIKNAFNP